MHLPAVHDGHSAGRHRFRGLLHLHQTHPEVGRTCNALLKAPKIPALVTAPAVSCNGEAIVVAKARDLYPSHGCGLQHCRARIHKYLWVGSGGIRHYAAKFTHIKYASSHIANITHKCRKPFIMISVISLHLFAIDETLQLLRGTAGHGPCRRGGGESPPVGDIKTFHVS